MADGGFSAAGQRTKVESEKLGTVLFFSGFKC